jgi:hypothetical protein
MEDADSNENPKELENYETIYSQHFENALKGEF